MSFRAHLLDLSYLLLLVAVSPWLLYAALRQGKYREGWGQKLWGNVPSHAGGRCIWIHAVSVGEINQLGPITELLKAQHPSYQLVISTTTKAGFGLAQRRYPNQLVFYCPLDFSWGVRRAVARLKPDLLVLVELELWPNLIAAVAEAGGRVAIINGRLSERSWRGYRRIRPLVRASLRRLRLIAVQTEAYRRRFLDRSERRRT